MQTKQIIDALGGRNVVAQATGSDPNTVIYWIRRGRIPTRHANILLKLAAQAGRHDITIDLLIPEDCAVERAVA